MEKADLEHRADLGAVAEEPERENGRLAGELPLPDGEDHHEGAEADESADHHTGRPRAAVAELHQPSKPPLEAPGWGECTHYLFPPHWRGRRRRVMVASISVVPIQSCGRMRDQRGQAKRVARAAHEDAEAERNGVAGRNPLAQSPPAELCFSVKCGAGVLYCQRGAATRGGGDEPLTSHQEEGQAEDPG